MLNKKESFSLIEVLVFTGILSVFFVLAASVVTVSLRNMKFNEHKIKANHYSKQLLDWLRSQKEIDWGGDQCSGNCCISGCGFTQRVTQTGLNPRFCFNDFPITSWPAPDASGCNGDYSLGSIFSREVQFSSSPVGGYIGQVAVRITVSWLEIGQPKSVTTNTTFSLLEQR